MKKVLLIGNGPSASRYEVGEVIDAFDGEIVRFNEAKVKGFESKVGSRTDVWVFCGNPPHVFRGKELGSKKVMMSYPQKFQEMQRHVWSQFVKDHGNDFDFIDMPWDLYQDVNEDVGHMPSSGILVANYFLKVGYEVSFFGFDHFQGSKHHYWEDLVVGDSSGHAPAIEKEWFSRKVSQGRLAHWKPQENPLYLKEQYRRFYASPQSSSYCSRAVEMYGPLFTKVFKELGVKSFLDWGCGTSGLGQYLQEKTGAELFRHDFALTQESPWIGEKVDLVMTTDVLEHIPLPNLSQSLQSLSHIAQCHLHAVCTRPALNHLPDGQNMHAMVRTASWWGGFLTGVYPENRGRPLESNRPDVYIFLSTP